MKTQLKNNFHAFLNYISIINRTHTQEISKNEIIHYIII